MSLSEGKSAETGAANSEEATDLADEFAAANDVLAADADAAEEATEVADNVAEAVADEVARAFHGSLCIGCSVCDAIFWANWLNDSWPLILFRAALFAPGEKVHIPPLFLSSVRVNSLLILRAWLMDLCHLESSSFA